MPSAKYTGNPTGSGNPPGQHSPSYTKKMTSKDGHFTNSKSYRGDMHVGIHSGEAPVVGNQPQENRTSSFEKLSKSTH